MAEQIAVFTTWGDLYKRMLDDLANDGWRRMQSYQVGGRLFSYRNFEGYLNLFKMVKTEAELESGIAPYRGRTYAGNRGRG